MGFDFQLLPCLLVRVAILQCGGRWALGPGSPFTFDPGWGTHTCTQGNCCGPSGKGSNHKPPPSRTTHTQPDILFTGFILVVSHSYCISHSAHSLKHHAQPVMTLTT